jgi:DNA-directed RNA polymerase subunit RPC12/RpoP
MAEKKIFKCRNCGKPVNATTRAASAGHGTVGEEYEPVTCPCGEKYSSSEVAAKMDEG